MKLKIFNTKRELREFKEYAERNFECYQSEIGFLKAEIFKMKCPNGDVCIDSYFSLGDGRIHFKYAYGNKIKTSSIAHIYNNWDVAGYKSVIKGKYAYLGLLFVSDGKSTEQYVILDMSDGKSIECSCQDIIGDVKWISVGE